MLTGIADTDIKELVIPSESPNGYVVTGIYFDCLKDCKKLESITIPSTVYDISPGLFYGCDSLTSITVEEGNENYHSEGNCLIYTEYCELTAACKTSVIPDYVEVIGSEAFAGLSIESFDVPENIVSIHDNAFKNCKSLRSVNISKNVHSISDNIFRGCSALEAITVDSENQYYYSVDNCLMRDATLIAGCKTSVLPSGVYKLGDGAFAGCSEMQSINIPNSLREIGEEVFDGCTSLTTINYNDTMYLWNALEKAEDWDYNMSSYTLYATDGELTVTQDMIDAE
jgi:hypothetical protein